MIKKLYITLSFVLLSFLGTIAYAQDVLPELKPSVTVDDNVITLNDLFSDLTEKQSIVIATAPEPGKRVLVSARHILKLTRANNVRWRNSAGVTNVIVTRMSTVVGYKDLADALTAELKNLNHSNRNLEIRFYNRNGKIHLPKGFDAADISIKNITVDRGNDKFSALVEQCEHLTLRGLMAIPKKNDSIQSFKKMAQLFEALKLKYPSVDTLSMGMSGDLQLAINAGSTLVRIGSAIFGARG